MDKKPQTIREAYLKASSFLEQHRIENAAAQAEWLLTAALGWERTTFFMEWNQPIGDGLWAGLTEQLHRRVAGEPIQYILGEQEFYGLTFKVTPDVLIPRPETELLVEAIVKRGKALNEQYQRSEQPLHIVDVGTGSGAIAVTLAKLCPNWNITASDISPEAIAVARSNAAIHQMELRVRFVQGDLLQPFVQQRETLDILVSNPPYIEQAVIEQLQQEVRDHEPRLALDGGEDGLNPYRTMVQQLKDLPRYPYVVGFEVGQGQASAVKSMLETLKVYTDIEIIPDLAGIDRHVVAWNLD